MFANRFAAVIRRDFKILSPQRILILQKILIQTNTNTIQTDDPKSNNFKFPLCTISTTHKCTSVAECFIQTEKLEQVLMRKSSMQIQYEVCNSKKMMREGVTGKTKSRKIRSGYFDRTKYSFNCKGEWKKSPMSGQLHCRGLPQEWRGARVE